MSIHKGNKTVHGRLSDWGGRSRRRCDQIRKTGSEEKRKERVLAKAKRSLSGRDGIIDHEGWVCGMVKRRAFQEEGENIGHNVEEDYLGTTNIIKIESIRPGERNNAL